MLKKYTFKVDLKNKGKRLDHFLYEECEKISELCVGDVSPSRSQIRKWILDRKVDIASRKIMIPTRLLGLSEQIHLVVDSDLEKQKMKSGKVIALRDIEIIFEDDFILVVSKPSGIPTQPTLDPNRQNLYELLKTRPGCDYLGLHHRLDVETSGVMVFTKKKEVNGAIGDAFKDREAEKGYLAIVCSKSLSTFSKKSWVIENYLKKETKKNGKMMSTRSGGDHAVTSFTMIAKKGDLALIACQPKTGRMHQIRVHLSESGLPILGDLQYGGVQKKGERVCLHAHRLTIPHPVDKLKKTFISALPKDFLPCLDLLSLSVKDVQNELNRIHS